MYGERPSFHELMLITNYVFGSEPPGYIIYMTHITLAVHIILGAG